MREILLKNRKGEIINKTIVDDDDYEKINEGKWFYASGYCIGYTKQYKGTIHRFILDCKRENKLLIDHINGNRLDNRKENLRFCTPSINSHNRIKKKNTTSKYIGVCRAKNCWKTTISFNYKSYYNFFKLESHAAYWYNVLALKYYNRERVNDIDRPEDFIDPVDKIAKKIVDKNSDKTSEKIVEKTIEKTIEKEKTVENIKRNKDGIAIITINKKNKNYECLIDDDDYLKLINYSWHLSHNYPSTKIENKEILMHRFILNAKEGDIIDHINKNELDNRKSNLRFSNRSLNSHNRRKKIEKYSSNFYGVAKRENGTFRSIINKDGIRYNIGSYLTELEAASAYNKKAIEIYGENYANLNILPENIKISPRIFFKKPGEKTNFNSYLTDSDGILQRVYSCKRNWDLKCFENSKKFLAAKKGELWGFKG